MRLFILGILLGIVTTFSIKPLTPIAEKNNDVWVVEYNRADFGDCNGVFETKEKAQKSIESDFERCSDIWYDIQLVHDEEEWKSWNFVIWCNDNQQYEEIEVSMYYTEIQ